MLFGHKYSDFFGFSALYLQFFRFSAFFVFLYKTKKAEKRKN